MQDSQTDPSATSASSLDLDWILIFTGWLIATVSALGSLFFSHVMDFAPCLLCWYQRICLFPLVFILARGLFPLDRQVVKYALPLTAAGWLVAVYHNLLHAGFIPANLQPCSKGVSCTEEYIQLLGFLSIPMLALFSFTAVLAILITLNKRNSQ